MFLRQHYKTERGKRVAYWALVESYRTERGLRQRVVAWLGKLDEAGRFGVRQAARVADAGEHNRRNAWFGTTQLQFEFDEEPRPPEPRWVEVNAAGVRVENLRHFGGPWLALELIRTLELDAFLQQVMPRGRETVPWSLSALVLVIGRLLDPSSELYTAEQWYPKTALLGVPARQVDDNRLYCALDKLLPHKSKLETFILCRSRDRFQKEDAITRRFELKIETALQRMAERCEKQQRDPMKVEREVGRLLGQNTRAARLFNVRVARREEGFARIAWEKIEAARDWATLTAGCYLLRSNVEDWTDEGLWKAYIQLTEAEAAFRIHKIDLSIRPIWHQKEERVLAHIFVCFLAYVLWKTLGQLCERRQRTAPSAAGTERNPPDRCRAAEQTGD